MRNIVIYSPDPGNVADHINPQQTNNIYSTSQKRRNSNKNSNSGRNYPDIVATSGGDWLFVPVGKELKCPINRPFTETEIESLLKWCEAVEKAVKEYEPAE